MADPVPRGLIESTKSGVLVVHGRRNPRIAAATNSGCDCTGALGPGTIASGTRLAGASGRVAASGVRAVGTWPASVGYLAVAPAGRLPTALTPLPATRRRTTC